ncbi:transposase [Leptothermofonsia sp. ETS-13]|uniref:transposase n=1 Tax=Leptothermofonsia sp. ETS-13 TaxID=3035696 RepID=UPI003BA2C3C1
MFTLIVASLFAALLETFGGLVSGRVWQHVQVLVIGAILCPGKRSASAILRVMGQAEERRFGKYHRVLSRAVWSSLKVARRLLGHLLSTFVPSGMVVMGIDDPIKRRKGNRIKAKGIYRDAVRSREAQVVKVRVYAG